MNPINQISSVRIDASTVCQLKCPLCPRFTGETAPVLGAGFLRFADFKTFLDHNPFIRNIEMGNFGEIFLNPELVDILRLAHERQVVIEFDEGVNLNDATDEALEAVVRYQVSVIRCAIDGATQPTYEIYRAGGQLKKVFANIQKINRCKQKYQSKLPRLIYQYVIFGHNEHEINHAKILARILRMKLSFKLNFRPDAMSIQHPDLVRSLVGYSDRNEYLAQTGKHYMRHLCPELWHRPQINWDGKLLGCCRNFWGVYHGNAFEHNIMDLINSEQISYARSMLMGKTGPRDDIPCLHCGVYHGMVEHDNWIRQEELDTYLDRLKPRFDFPPVGENAWPGLNQG